MDSGAMAMRTPGAVSGPDAAGLLDLFDQGLGPVYRYLYRACGGCVAVAEDLTQETFLAAVSAVRGGRGEQVTLPWLLVVARHKLVDDWRRREREERALPSVGGSEGASTEVDDGGASTALAASPAAAVALLAGLPVAQRAALALRYVDDLAVVDVAHALGRSVHATESLLARGRATLKRRSREADHG